MSADRDSKVMAMQMLDLIDIDQESPWIQEAVRNLVLDYMWPLYLKYHITNRFDNEIYYWCCANFPSYHMAVINYYPRNIYQTGMPLYVMKCEFQYFLAHNLLDVGKIK